MKSFLHKLPFLCLTLIAFVGRAQVTRLSNNTNLETAIPMGSFAVLISESDSLWRTDGTPEPTGTFKYATSVAVDTAHNYIVVGNKIYFAGVDADGIELWVTDGTALGTTKIKDINISGDSYPRHFVTFNGNVYFFADNGTDGVELWKTDGTGPNTTLVKDINPSGSSLPTYPSLIPPFDPTDVGGQYFIKNNFLYFTADDGTNGVELWKTDGTGPNTTLVKDINPSTGPIKSSFPTGFYPYGSDYLFCAYTADDGRSLWKTDGSGAGTQLVKAFDPTEVVFLPYFPAALAGFITFNNKVYFDVNDPTNGIEGWVTDGTTAGTAILKDINPGSSSGFPRSGFPFLFNALFLNNLMYFGATTGDEDTELWTSDGTGANTNLFKDINTGTAGSTPFFLLNGNNAIDINSYHSILFNGIAFMQAGTAASGLELWKTDGTSGGTVIVKDINPGADSAIVDTAFTYFYTSNNLYFSANDGTSGNELWKSDGTDPNTTQVFDINPGGPGSDPRFLGSFNGIYLFTANDGDNINGNRDLFRLDGTFNALPLNLLDFTGAVRDRAVRLNWTTTQETNTAYFDVERSVDGRDFKYVGKVAAQKNSNAKKNYQFDDGDALTLAGKVYYRLKMVDEDGKFKYSKIVAFSKLTTGQLLTYPNPVIDELKVTINSGLRKQLSLAIFDQAGKQVYSQQLGSLQGNNSYSINVSSFAKGSYYVNVITDGGVETAKFVKR